MKIIMKFCKVLLLLTAIVLIACVFTACDGAGEDLAKYTVVFDSRNGDEMRGEKDVVEGSHIAPPSVPIKTGYDFSGWYNEKTETKWNFDTDTVVYDLKLYAEWTPKTYSITYLDEDGAAFSGTHGASKPTIHTFGSATNLVSPAKTGYIFGGWFIESDVSGEALTALAADGYTANITLYAKWDADSYTVNYDANNGTGDTDSGVFFYGVEKALALNGFIYDGYVFAGWNTRSDGNGTGYSENENVINLAEADSGAVTLYAKWAAKLNTVSFNANTGAGEMQDQKLHTDESAPLNINTFTKTGYSFIGWSLTSTGEVAYLNGAGFTMTPEDTVVLFAKWTPITNITVSFEKYSGTGSAEDIFVTFDSAYGELPAGLSKTGYSFSGWWTDENGTGTEITEATTVRTAVAHIVYAKWEPLPHTLVFQSNVPSDSTVVGNTENIGTFTGEQPVMPASGYTAGGYFFYGWRTSPDGGDLYSSGESFTVPETDDEEIIFYAVWNARSYRVTLDPDGGAITPLADGVEMKTFTVRFDLNGVAGYVDTQTVTENTGLEYPDVPSGDIVGNNYRLFSGWYTASTGNTLFNFSAGVTENVTVYAHWTEVAYLNSENRVVTDYTGTNRIYYNSNTSAYRAAETYFIALTSGTLTMSYDSTSQSTRTAIQAFDGTSSSVIATINNSNSTATFSVVAGRLYRFKQSTSEYYSGEGYFRFSGGAYPVSGGKAQSKIYTMWIKYGAEWGDFAEAERGDYIFGGWFTEKNGGGSPIGSNALITADTTFYANWIPTIFALTAESGNGGAAAGNANVKQDTSATVTATPNDGYKFIGWYDADETRVSEDAEYSFTMPHNDLTLTARFEALPFDLTVIVISAGELNDDGGSVDITSGTYLCDESVTLTVTNINTDYLFDGWYEGGTLLSSSSTFVFTMPAYAVEVSAVFRTLPFMLNLYSVDGSVSGGGMYDYGSSVVITATPPADFNFGGWYIGSDLVSKDNPYSFSMPKNNYSLTAKWEVSYIDEDGLQQFIDYTDIQHQTTPFRGGGATGWFLLTGSGGSYASWVSVSGEANIILADGANWSFDYISVSINCQLNIYAESNGQSMGKITLSTGYIGGADASGTGAGSNSGNITIAGGVITAVHIGGGNGNTTNLASGCVGGNSGIITITGGIVTATNIGGGNGATSSTGGVNGGNSQSIIIKGGNVNAANIGGGKGGNGPAGYAGHGGESGSIIISGGVVTAERIGGGVGGNGGNAGNRAGGNGGNSGIINISGGYVTADTAGGGEGGNSGSGGNGGTSGKGGNSESIAISGGFISILRIGGGNGGALFATLGGTSGNGGDGGDITISGGTISADRIGAGEYDNASTNISSSSKGVEAMLVITGGSVNAIIPDGADNGADNGAESLSLVILTTASVNAAVDSGVVTDAEYYSFEGAVTDENGNLYLWLSSDTASVSVIIDGIPYTLN